MNLKPDPMGIPRNAFHVFLFIVALLNGLSFIFGQPTSGTLEAELNPLLLQGYGTLLASSTTMVLSGMYWQGTPSTGLLLKRTGYLGLCVTTAIYAVALIRTNYSLDVVLATSITASFSAVCGSQVVRINRLVKRRMGDF